MAESYGCHRGTDVIVESSICNWTTQCLASGSKASQFLARKMPSSPPTALVVNIIECWETRAWTAICWTQRLPHILHDDSPLFAPSLHFIAHSAQRMLRSSTRNRGNEPTDGSSQHLARPTNGACAMRMSCMHTTSQPIHMLSRARSRHRSSANEVSSCFIIACNLSTNVPRATVRIQD
eukprot:6214564-Pleurochrysis_carterae.AAC.5